MSRSEAGSRVSFPKELPMADMDDVDIPAGPAQSSRSTTPGPVTRYRPGLSNSTTTGSRATLP